MKKKQLRFIHCRVVCFLLIFSRFSLSIIIGILYPGLYNRKWRMRERNELIEGDVI